MADFCNPEHHEAARECLETLWRTYKKRRIHPEAEENQIRCTRDAFFSGGQAIVILLMSLRDIALEKNELTKEDIEQGAAQIHAIVRELTLILTSRSE